MLTPALCSKLLTSDVPERCMPVIMTACDTPLVYLLACAGRKIDLLAVMSALRRNQLAAPAWKDASATTLPQPGQCLHPNRPIA
jgi:hypothetical protein